MFIFIGKTLTKYESDFELLIYLEKGHHEIQNATFLNKKTKVKLICTLFISHSKNQYFFLYTFTKFTIEIQSNNQIKARALVHLEFIVIII